jgi:hypothetical protein
MNKYWCRQNNCKNRWVKIELPETQKCECCGITMSMADDVNLSSIYFGKVSSMSVVDRKAVLKKRADDHNKSKSVQEKRKHIEQKNVKNIVG